MREWYSNLTPEQSEAWLGRIVAVAMVAVLALITAGVIFVSRQLGPSCLDTWNIPDPGIAIIVFIGQLDEEEPQFSLDEPIQDFGWMVGNNKVKMYIDNGDLYFYGEPCFHDETLDFQNIEIRAAVES